MSSENSIQNANIKPRYSVISLILPLLAAPLVYFLMHQSNTFNGLFYPLLAIVAVAVIGVTLAFVALYRKEKPVKISYIALVLNVLAGLAGIAYLFALTVFSLLS
jgi:type IV secretory pathway VirB2 component (pilin)